MSAHETIRLGALPDVAAFRAALGSLGIELPVDDELRAAPDGPLAAPILAGGFLLKNRFAVHPMEGWDGAADGAPTEAVVRRWRRFGASGAALVWGCEAVAVREDGRANPRQLVINSRTVDQIARAREALVSEHVAHHGTSDGLIVGLQLTHSGRYSRPEENCPRPVIAFRHPILDRRMGLPADYPVVSDGAIRSLIADFGVAARLAQQAGFDFIDIKHCHGYLAHELLAAHTRPGPYGGDFAGRTRFLTETIDVVRSEAPGLGIGVRFSAFDIVPYRPDPEQTAPGRPGPGVPEPYCDAMPYLYGFGVDPDQPTEIDLAPAMDLARLLQRLGIRLVSITAGSPYGAPHIQRPASHPPSDAYLPPEDPLIGVARQIHAVRCLKEAAPQTVCVGSAYTYLQQFAPHVAQAVVRERWVDLVGLGRMMLSYPEMPADVLAGRPIMTRRICRTLSDCTTAPRSGLPSGCFPLDPHYRDSEAGRQLALRKQAKRHA